MQTSKTKPKEVQKNKTKKIPTKVAEKGSNAKTKKSVIAKSKVEVSGLLPLTPQQEEKFNKSFNSLERYLAFGAYASILYDLFAFYLIIKSKGNLVVVLAFIISVMITVGLFYSSRLFSKQDKNSLIAFSSTLAVVILFSVSSRLVVGSSPFVARDILSYLIPSLILLEMFRLKKYNFLF